MAEDQQSVARTTGFAIDAEAGKLHAPSAARNVDAIVKAMAAFIPAHGKALEIASGTGEHVLRHAVAFPKLVWQPTDIGQDRLNSIAAWRAEAKLENILKPKILNATLAGWAMEHAGQNLIILSNLLHLISEPEAVTLLSEAAAALDINGVFMIYGPFLRGTDFASNSDRDFHERLNAQDAAVGYKSFQFVQATLRDNGLETIGKIDMPANNLMLVFKNT